MNFFKVTLFLIFVARSNSLKPVTRSSCDTDEQCPPNEKCVGITWPGPPPAPRVCVKAGSRLVDECKVDEDCEYNDEKCTKHTVPDAPAYLKCKKVPTWCLQDRDCRRAGESCIGATQNCGDFCKPEFG